MKSNLIECHRHSIRLKGYDYSLPGAYFITLVTWKRECKFGEVIQGMMYLNQAGKIVESEWQRLINHFPGVQLGEFTIMPNHFHGILIITGSTVGATRAASIQALLEQETSPNEAEKWPDGSPLRNAQQKGPAKGSLGAMIAQFKSRVTKRIWKCGKTGHEPVWQRNYYEHVIRNQDELQKITDYIHSNPANWESDDEYPN